MMSEATLFGSRLPILRKKRRNLAGLSFSMEVTGSGAPLLPPSDSPRRSKDGRAHQQATRSPKMLPPPPRTRHVYTSGCLLPSKKASPIGRTTSTRPRKLSKSHKERESSALTDQLASASHEENQHARPTSSGYSTPILKSDIAAFVEPAPVASTFSYGNKTYSIFSSGSVDSESKEQRVELKEGAAEAFGAVEASYLSFECRKSNPSTPSSNRVRYNSDVMGVSGITSSLSNTAIPLLASGKHSMSQNMDLPPLDSLSTAPSPVFSSRKGSFKSSQPQPQSSRKKPLGGSTSWQDLLQREQQKASKLNPALSRSTDQRPLIFTPSSPQAPPSITHSLSPKKFHDACLRSLQEAHLHQMEQQNSFLAHISAAPIHTQDPLKNGSPGNAVELEEQSKEFERQRLAVESEVLSKIAALEMPRDLEMELDNRLELERDVERERREMSWEKDIGSPLKLFSTSHSRPNLSWIERGGSGDGDKSAATSQSAGVNRAFAKDAVIKVPPLNRRERGVVFEPPIQAAQPRNTETHEIINLEPQSLEPKEFSSWGDQTTGAAIMLSVSGGSTGQQRSPVILKKKVRRKLKKQRHLYSSGNNEGEEYAEMAKPETLCFIEKKKLIPQKFASGKKAKRKTTSHAAAARRRKSSPKERIDPLRNRSPKPSPGNVSMGMLQISATPVKRAARKSKVESAEEKITKEDMEVKAQQAREYRLQTRRRVAARREQLRAMAEQEAQQKVKQQQGAGLERKTREAQKQRLRTEIYGVNELNMIFFHHKFAEWMVELEKRRQTSLTKDDTVHEMSDDSSANDSGDEVMAMEP